MHGRKLRFTQLPYSPLLLKGLKMWEKYTVRVWFLPIFCFTGVILKANFGGQHIPSNHKPEPPGIYDMSSYHIRKQFCELTPLVSSNENYFTGLLSISKCYQLKNSSESGQPYFTIKNDGVGTFSDFLGKNS